MSKTSNPDSGSEIVIRAAVASDAAAILGLIKELAEYERLSHEVTATVENIRASLFGGDPAAEVLIADLNGSAVGFALYFHNYSTFLGKRGIYLEDLYVQPSYRGKGIGLRLFREVARIAVERDCGRMEWSVLDWNEPALNFYRSLGAVPMSEWTVQRLTGQALE
ncbi:MAG: GNAT family N-acetyltransferase, partial [Deltaproteobacteria bacterium]|nr:GNAT family N-acetyltransferase [Deltaproteobacteria bacterium]